MNALLPLLTCMLAFTLLALALDRHQKSVFGHRLSTALSRALWIAGWSALILALWQVVTLKGWALGLVSYSGNTSLAAGLVYGVLILYERRTG